MQWYERNKALFDAEVALMKKRFPNAKYGFIESNKNMFWILKMEISATDAFEPWTFLLVYRQDHPNNNAEAGSIRVVPLIPNPETLMNRVKEAKGRYNLPNLTVPHLLLEKEKNIIYLCTREVKDIASGERKITSAVQTAAWAAEWALYFELSMIDNNVWNKWVDYDGYRRLIIK